MTKRPLLAATVICLLVAIASAHIQTVTINMDDRSEIFLGDFGFSHTGHVNISVEQVAAESYTAAGPDPSRLGFVILAEVAIGQVLLERRRINRDFCILNSDFVLQTFNFQELSPVSHTFLVKAPNMYRLLFVNCAAPLTVVTMTVRLELYNLNDGAARDYLSTGSTNLPLVFLSFSFYYFFMLGFWIYLCFSNKALVLRIHFLIAGILLVKMFSLVCASEEKRQVKVTGMPHGWDIAHHMFQTASAVQLYAAITLIGAGWSTSLKPLQGMEKIILMIVIPLQVLPYAAENENKKALLAMTNLACSWLMIWPVHGSVCWTVRKLESFFLVVVFYLFVMLFVKLMILLREGRTCTSDYETVMEETVNLVFNTVVIYLFSTEETSQYLIPTQNHREE